MKMAVESKAFITYKFLLLWFDFLIHRVVILPPQQPRMRRHEGNTHAKSLLEFIPKMEKLTFFLCALEQNQTTFVEESSM